MTTQFEVAQEIALKLANISAVEAVVLTRSHDDAERTTDIALVVYAREANVPLEKRRAIIENRAEKMDLNLQFGEPRDQWLEAGTGFGVDVCYRDVNWVIDETVRVMVQHKASLGYSTHLIYSVLHSESFYDRGNWYKELQKTAQQPYPNTLVRSIIDANHAALVDSVGAYNKQLARIVAQQDVVGQVQCVSALLASYFDVLFAANRQYHPGEAYLLQRAAALDSLPANMADDVQAVIGASANDPTGPVNALLSNMDAWLKETGLYPGAQSA